MNTLNFKTELLAIQDELLRFAYKLTADPEEANDLLQETSLKALDNEDKFEPDTNFRGWMYTIMRNIFINNYRKQVRDQTFVDQTENLFHLNQSKELAYDSTEEAYDLKEIHLRQPSSQRIPYSFLYARVRIQVSRDCRETGIATRHGQEPYLLHPPTSANGIERFPLTPSPS